MQAMAQNGLMMPDGYREEIKYFLIPIIAHER
jgi:hypothetical protein